MISNIASGMTTGSTKKANQGLAINEGVDHYKKIFTFIQRKVEYENFRFKHPTLLAIVIEAINTKVTDNQRMFTSIFYRFHVSQDITIGDLAETIKFRINCQVGDPK